MSTEKIIPLNNLVSLLSQDSLSLDRQIGTCPMQLSLPTDGKGVRIKVSVQSGHRSEIPDEISYSLDANAYAIPLDVQEDYQHYVIQ
jgi:hypothetical protein